MDGLTLGALKAVREAFCDQDPLHDATLCVMVQVADEITPFHTPHLTLENNLVPRYRLPFCSTAYFGTREGNLQLRIMCLPRPLSIHRLRGATNE